MLSRQKEMAERRRVFAQDQSVPSQATTFHQHAQADADIPRGRFTAHERSTVVGATANPYGSLPKMPEGNPWAGPDLVGDEPPLSAYDNPALEPSALPSAEVSGPEEPPSDHSPLHVEIAGPSSSWRRF
jgi:hypothetical protein